MKTSNSHPIHQATKGQFEWVKTPVANLVRYKASGIYFTRVHIRGKLFRHSLQTDVMSVAKLRLADFVKEKREDLGDDSAVRSGKMTVGDAVAVFRQRLDAQQNIKKGAKVYRRKCIEAFLKSWPELAEKPVAKISRDECLTWAERFAGQYSASVYNNTVGTLRMILAVAVERGARATNPADAIAKKQVALRELHLPSPDQFECFLTAIEEAGAWCSRECADLVRFLSYGGLRKTEAAHVTWADCQSESEQIRARVTKNGKARTVPMIPDMKKLLQRLRIERGEVVADGPVMLVRECQKAMDRAAKMVGMKRITHHDLRHLFATRCIESGVDIPYPAGVSRPKPA